jgi:hypothetical protein
VICEGGYADIIANNHRAAAQMQTILPNVYALFSGKRVYQATYEPYTTSTDSWATTANQTADATNGDRITMNTAIRGGLGGIAGYFDIASVAESALNSGKWKAPNWTSDGLHGNQNANANFSNSTIWTPFIGANLHFSTASGDKDSLVTISPNSQLATAQAGIGGNGAQVIAKPGTTTGKMYFAATIGSVAPAAGIGIGLSTDQFTTGVTYLGGNTASLCLYGNAAVVLNGVALATYFTLAANDVVELAVDIPNKLLWLRKNGGNWNNSGAANPATGAGGLSISSLVGTTINPAFSLQGTGESWTINKSLTPPSGFSYFG